MINYTSKITGRLYHNPPSKQEALDHRTVLYNDENNTCPRCNMRDTTRYTSDDTCVKCMIEGYNDLDTGERVPGYNEQRLTNDWDVYTLTHKACKGGSHLARYHAGTKKCATCDELKTLSPRQVAIAAGETWYTPATACPRCNTHALRSVNGSRCKGCSPSVHQGSQSPRKAAIAAGETWYMPSELDYCGKCGTRSLRNVHNGRCQGCKLATDRRVKPNPLPGDTVMDRGTARSLGFTHYRTGNECKRGHASFRYVSTGQCTECPR